MIVPFTPQNLDHLQWSNNSRRRCKIQNHYEKKLLTWCAFACLCEYNYTACTADTTWFQHHSCYATLRPEQQKKELEWLHRMITRTHMATARSSEAKQGAKSICRCGLHQYLVDSSEDCNLLKQQRKRHSREPKPRPALLEKFIKIRSFLHCD